MNIKKTSPVGIFISLVLLTGCGSFDGLSSGLGSLSLSSASRSNAVSVAKLACDGATDDTATLQSQINDAVGNVLIIGGAKPCMISQTLNVPSNSHLTVNGTLLLKANANVDIFSLNNASNVIIDGSGVIDGNWNLQPTTCNSVIGCAGINAQGGGNVVIGSSSARLTIQHVINWPVNLVTVNGAQMINLTAVDSGDSVEFASGTHDCQASGLRISGIHDMGFAFYGGVVRCNLSNSVISGNYSDGVTVLSDAGQAAPCSDISISNVESYGNIGSSAISIAVNTGGQGPQSNITVTNMYSHDNGRSDIYDTNGVNVTFINFTSKGPATVTGNAPFNMVSPVQLGSTSAPPATTTSVPTTSNPAPIDGTIPSNASILGVIDGVFPDGAGAYYIRGWACLTYDPNPIPVDLYLNGSAGSPGAVGIGRFQSGIASEGAVAASCQSSGTAYRFQIPLSQSFINSNHGASIYVHGISPIASFSNNLMSNSGEFRIP